MLDPSIFSKYKSKQDFDLERQEFEQRKRQQAMQEQLGQIQLQKAQQELSQPKMPFQGTGLEPQLINQKYMANLQAGMDKQQALQNATDTVLQSKVSLNPDTGEIIRRQPIYGSPSQINQMPPSEVMGMPTQGMRLDSGMVSPTTQPVPNTGDFMPVDTSQPDLPMTGLPQDMVDPIQNIPMPNTQGLNPAAAQAATEGAVQANIDLQKDITKMNYSDKLRAADEALKSQEGKSKVADIITRMQTINEALKQRNAIVSNSGNLMTRAGTAAATSPIGQIARKVTDPESQALAAEYEKLQATLLPFFAKASGLGAKSLDSEGERKSIMGSFGDPGGIYETNVNQLSNLEKLFGVGNNAGSAQKSDPLGLFNQ